MSGITRNISVSNDNWNFFVLGGIVKGGQRGVETQIVGDCMRFDSSVPKWDHLVLSSGNSTLEPGNFAFAQSCTLGQWIVIFGGGISGTNLWAVDTRALSWGPIIPDNFKVDTAPVSRWKHSCDFDSVPQVWYCFGGESLDPKTPGLALNDLWALPLKRVRHDSKKDNRMACFDGQNDIINIDMEQDPISFSAGVTLTVEMWFVIHNVASDCMTLVALLAFQNPILVCLDYGSGHLRVVGQDRSLPSTLAPRPRCVFFHA